MLKLLQYLSCLLPSRNQFFRKYFSIYLFSSWMFVKVNSESQIGIEKTNWTGFMNSNPHFWVVLMIEHCGSFLENSRSNSIFKPCKFCNGSIWRSRSTLLFSVDQFISWEDICCKNQNRWCTILLKPNVGKLRSFPFRELSVRADMS